MGGDNYNHRQEGTSRVRHVPIQIESRDNRTRGNQRQFVEKDRANQHFQQQGYQHQNQHSSHYSNEANHTLPNTSSINIDYNPQQHSAASAASRSDQTSNQQEDKRTSYDPQQDQSSQENQSPSSQEKLASPPKVIPLPPPPKTPEPDHARGASGDRNNSPDQKQSQQQPSEHKCKSTEKRPKNVLTSITDVKSDVTNLLKAIANFSGTSAKSKEYRYLDEMLTRCVLNLDTIECGNSVELKQYRKAAIKLVDKATDILQRKLQINLDIHELSENMATSS